MSKTASRQNGEGVHVEVDASGLLILSRPNAAIRFGIRETPAVVQQERNQIRKERVARLLKKYPKTQ